MTNNPRSLVVAVVTDNKDPAGMGRVRVSIPALRGEHENAWARLASPMTGKAYGVVMIPEIGDEVVIGCLDDNFQSPIVLGSLWNEGARPPVTNDARQINKRVIRSRNGHSLTFDDGERGGIEIAHCDGHRIKLGVTTLIIEDNKGSRIALDSSNGSITIQAAGKLVIRASKIETHVEDDD